MLQSDRCLLCLTYTVRIKKKKNGSGNPSRWCSQLMLWCTQTYSNERENVKIESLAGIAGFKNNANIFKN